ncbi:MAG: tRNA (N(6)-L-threonylcarbamoyladenosine(37)-C(2))-methylthiotransferase MtaB [Rikenellaceae bacterium]|jgi:threonylcarbamoyladenosine tRNA methylthiotransferase MtaB|nr:tRNA (N(6)-L-threonylcarbamoyladenosine(37)-C(2))-methylthiotransferase MtaB [Rikenellaceae bacterium]
MEHQAKKAAFYTLGCKLNFSETSTLAREFEQAGIVRAARSETADVCVVNTCSVTEHSDKKCRNIIRKIVRENPGAIVAVTGCYAQLRPADVAAIEGVDLVIGNNEKGSLPERVRRLSGKGRAAAVHTCDAEELTSFFAAFSSGDRTRAFLKVQDGCDYRCSYCTIPLARGGSRNIFVKELVTEADQIARGGQKEIVVTGINTGDFGRTTGESFLDLLRALDEVKGIERYRISSIEPNLLTDEIIAFTAASEKFQPHFHVPLQSGSDRILSLMRRRYTTAAFADRIAAVRRMMPDAFLGIDVIVGFPGETETDFEETFRFLERVEPAFIHVFPYSVRPNTPAAAMPDKVAPQVAAKRVARLMALSESNHRHFIERFSEQETDVLFEGFRKGGAMFGYTGNYIRVEAPCLREAINTIRRVRLGSIVGYTHAEGVVLA